ncbi:hypothetical protein FRC09_015558 [Ceratobasidium sp. 395]|nr:hypothetical protein FRC09_015558 [Ceratobasidium sp. 395]
MLAFSRLTSFLLFVLSLSFLTCALRTPAVAGSKELAVRDGGAQALLDICIDLEAKVAAKVQALGGCNNVADAKVGLVAIVDLIDAAAKAVSAVGKVEVTADVTVQIVAHVSAMICVVLKLCLELCAKFGLTVFLALLAQLDVCLRLLVLNIDLCMQGFAALLAKAVVDGGINLEVCLQLHLTLFAAVCGFIGL